MSNERNLTEKVNMESAKQMGETIKEAASAGLTIQSYCIGMQQQPFLLLPEDLKSKIPDVNEYLKTAKKNAGNYLAEVEPGIINVITDLGAFSTQFPMFAKTISDEIKDWRNGSEAAKKSALNDIKYLKKMIATKVDNVQVVCTGITGIENLFGTDVSNFNTVSSACSALITGDKGELETIKKELDSLNGKIAGASVGVGLSGLAVIGGVFMILVGSIASFVTAGTSTSLVVAGGIITGIGVGGAVASSVVLANLVKAKGELLNREAVLNEYVAALTGCKSNVDLLYSGAQNAVTNLNDVRNAWNFMSSDLDKVIEDLDTSASFTELPKYVQIYFDAAGEQWGDVKADIDTIKKQMAGVQIKSIDSNKNRIMTVSNIANPFPLGRINEDAVKMLA